eukprot:c52757_g1_i1.p1 GENE.c52757_g1_i1~~c52757_g1_i1.p1  ORF type:complete len:724 (+),score=176.48 c52757_g1_i1:220-2172(+)
MVADWVAYLMDNKVETQEQLRHAEINLRRKHKPWNVKKSEMTHVLLREVAKGTYKLEDTAAVRKLLIKKASKSQSGVLVVTVLTSPYPQFTDANGVRQTQKFSCKYNCYFCPNEPGQPRSYLHDEPSVLRANRNGFDPVCQFFDRTVTLAMNGHPIDKIELLILGGTWSSYPHEYQEEFIRDLFYAANIFWEVPRRKERLSLAEEQAKNEKALCKIIGITLETRPDCVTRDEIFRFRRYGCTRVQLGLQHTDESILRKINRGCTTQDAIAAIRLLKDACYKMDVHLMPNLPGASPEIDREMFLNVLSSPDLQVDQWKIYPCEVVPWTVIKQWHKSGEYLPYADEALFDLLIDVLPRIHPWIRVNRVIRDIPSQYILAGVDNPNMRQALESHLKATGKQLMDIRSREVKENEEVLSSAEIVVREYVGSERPEFFISVEASERKLICGFTRLRLPDLTMEPVFEELRDCALIRELHVYGKLVATADKKSSHAQHVGFGTQLVRAAESIAAQHGYKRVAIIAGVGVRDYYRRLGYALEGEGQFMIRTLEPEPNNTDNTDPSATNTNPESNDPPVLWTRLQQNKGEQFVEWTRGDMLIGSQRLTLPKLKGAEVGGEGVLVHHTRPLVRVFGFVGLVLALLAVACAILFRFAFDR